MKSYSQFGEDLILLDFFSKTKLNKGFFFEFGAWDGIYLSNCRLFYEKGWEGCFVEISNIFSSDEISIPTVSIFTDWKSMRSGA